MPSQEIKNTTVKNDIPQNTPRNILSTGTGTNNASTITIKEQKQNLKQGKIKTTKYKREIVNPNLEGLDKIQEEMKLSFHNFIKKLINKIIEMFSKFFKKFLPKYILAYKANRKAKKERDELTKKILNKKQKL